MNPTDPVKERHTKEELESLIKTLDSLIDSSEQELNILKDYKQELHDRLVLLDRDTPEQIT